MSPCRTAGNCAVGVVDAHGLKLSLLVVVPWRLGMSLDANSTRSVLKSGSTNEATLSKQAMYVVGMFGEKNGVSSPAITDVLSQSKRMRAIRKLAIPEVVASAPSAEDIDANAEDLPRIQRTEFGVDVGGANSLSGLRALWRGLLKSNSALSALRPVIAVKENRNGLGLQLRLIAGPLGDAATAAKICAALTESQRACETAVFDGQRLAMKADETPVIVRPAPRRRGSARHGVVLEEAPKKPEPSPSTLSLLFKRDRAN